MGYRTTFLLSLVHTFVLPPVVVSFILHFFSETFSVPLLSVISVPVAFALQTLWTSHQHASAARRLNALPIPVVRGKWIGNLDILKVLLHGWRNGYINDTLREFFIQYQSPTINLRILWVDQIWTMDPNHMKHILVSGFQEFDKGAPQRERMKGFLGTGIFAADGDMWKMHRSMARPFLAKSTTSDVNLFTRHTDDAFGQLDRLVSSSTAFDMQEFSQRYTLDVALDSFFGIRDSGTLRDPLRLPGSEMEKEKVADYDINAITGDISTNRAAMLAATHAMDESADVTILRARQGILWPLIEFRTDKQEKPGRIMRKWIGAVIQKAKKAKRDVYSSEPVTFLEHLVRSTDDEEVIRDQLINIVLGARDTSVAFFTFTIYFLALHPEVYAKLRAEVMELCPPGREMPDSERIKDFVYLRAVMNETQRIFPSVPINTRYSASESVFPPAVWAPHGSKDSATAPIHYTQPLYMPPRTSVSLVKLLMQRRADLWGPDAEEYRPSRWLPTEQGGDGASETGGGGMRPEWFIPFSAGPRLCQGKNFAYAEVAYLLLSIIQRGYAFELAPEAQPPLTRPPEEWKSPRPIPDTANKRIFIENARQSKEQCWPAAAFTLYSKGGLWMTVSKKKTD